MHGRIRGVLDVASFSAHSSPPWKQTHCHLLRSVLVPVSVEFGVVMHTLHTGISVQAVHIVDMLKFIQFSLRTAPCVQFPVCVEIGVVMETPHIGISVQAVHMLEVLKFIQFSTRSPEWVWLSLSRHSGLYQFTCTVRFSKQTLHCSVVADSACRLSVPGRNKSRSDS